MPIDIECVLEVKESDIWVGTDELNNLSIFAGADSDLIFGINKIQLTPLKRARVVCASE